MKQPRRLEISPVAPNEDVRRFVDEEIMSPAATVPRRPQAEPRRALQQVLRELHDDGINAGLQTFAWCGLRLWIGDPANGKAVEATVNDRDEAWLDDDSLANWLHETAIRLYPDSDYAKRNAAPSA